MATVVLDRISKTYENGFQAVEGLSLDVADGEFLVLVGPSGCGKSTALRMIAGLESISGGTLSIAGGEVNDLAPKERDIAMVFQNYALYPHMTVAENVGFPLKLAKMKPEEIKRRVTEACEVLELVPEMDRKPGQLSGGQRQRVAMGRAIVREPAAFLMDEPLSNLDAKLRVQMRAEIAAIQRKLGVTTIYVTHDQVEAMTMGHRVAVLRDGVLQQVDEPQELYDNPRNAFVAAFIGSPAMNLFRAQIQLNDSPLVILGDHQLPITDSLWLKRPGLHRYHKKDVILGIRPESFSDPAAKAGETVGPQLRARVDFVEALGSELLVHLHLHATTIDSGDPDAPDQLDQVDGANAVARIAPHSLAGSSEFYDFAIDVDNLHFFDLETHLAIGD